MNDNLMTTNAVATKTALHPTTICRLVRAGALPAVRIGGRFRFEPRDVEGFIRERKENVKQYS